MNVEVMFIDRADVSRNVEIKTEWGETKHTRSEVLTNVPCRVSKTSTTVTNEQTESVNEFFNRYRVFLSSNLNIVVGDFLKVTTSIGQELHLKAGQPFKYPSHQEVVCTIEGEA